MLRDIASILIPPQYFWSNDRKSSFLSLLLTPLYFYIKHDLKKNLLKGHLLAVAILHIA